METNLFTLRTIAARRCWPSCAPPDAKLLACPTHVIDTDAGRVLYILSRDASPILKPRTAPWLCLLAVNVSVEAQQCDSSTLPIAGAVDEHGGASPTPLVTTFTQCKPLHSITCNCRAVRIVAVARASGFNLDHPLACPHVKRSIAGNFALRAVPRARLRSSAASAGKIQRHGALVPRVKRGLKRHDRCVCCGSAGTMYREYGSMTRAIPWRG